jgi:hypothetical protein
VEKENIAQDILRRALEAFKEIAPTQTTVEVKPPKEIPTDARQPNLTLRLVLQGKALAYHTKIEPTVTKAHRLLLLMGRERRKNPPLLVTRYVNPEMAEELRQNGIEFIDTSGNVFLNQPPVYVFVKGNKLREPNGKAPVKRVFKAAGLKMVFAFLCDPGLAGKPFRQIAANTDVALGTVNWIMRELKELGYILDLGDKGLKLVRKEELLQRWVTAYPDQLRPKQFLGRYRGEINWWERNKMDAQKVQWGGEVAAAKLTGYLKPETITLYTTAGQLNQVLLENKLRRDEKGDVEILERFWQQAIVQTPKEAVHPILIYADLLATGNQRNLETAKQIYERYILQLVGKD